MLLPAAQIFLESLVTKGDRNSPAQSCRFSDLLSDARFTITFTLTSPVSELARSVAQPAPGASEVAAQITHKSERRETLVWHRYQPPVGGYQDR